MPENLPSIIIFSLFVGIWLLALIRFIGNKLAPVKTVKAQVTHKQRQEVFSKYSGKQQMLQICSRIYRRGKDIVFLCF